MIYDKMNIPRTGSGVLHGCRPKAPRVADILVQDAVVNPSFEPVPDSPHGATGYCTV
jgi:hypothetical protein